MAMEELVDAALAHCMDDVRRHCEWRLQSSQDRAADLKAVLSLAPADFPKPDRVYVGDIVNKGVMYASASWRAGKCYFTLTCEQNWPDRHEVVSFVVDGKAYDGGEFSDETYDVFRKRIVYDSPDDPQRVLDLVRQQIEKYSKKN